MFRITTASMLAALLVHLTLGAPLAHAQQLRVDLNPAMLTNEADVGDPAGLVDEQRLIVGPPAGEPKHAWTIPSQHNKRYPFSTYLDLGEVKNLSTFWIYDTNGTGQITISAGTPGQWQEIASYDCGSYLKWASIPLEVTTRYLLITRVDPGANFTEIAVYEYTPEAYQEMVQRKAEEARRVAEREAALKAAREAALKRPIIELAPYGRLSLVDEIDCASAGSEHLFAEVPAGASRVEAILGSPTRVLSSTAKSAAYFSYRIGKMKLLRPGGVYVLTVEYPEDQPRTILVTNTGNETTRGFHTGLSLGDAMHPKYVNNFVESLDLPLSGKWETWSLLIRLHDRFPAKGLVRGSGQRPLTPEDGFDVVIGQFSAPNLPLSHGAAVRRIALYEVLDPEQMAQPVKLPPQDLPRRHLFWREEMADGVLGGKNDKPEDRGLVERLDWYRHKAELMRFLGMNTYTKDLLEFGACQHWDSTLHGGNQWVYFDGTTKDLWGQIVELMGQYGFDLLPYYEYSGSKGSQGLGNQRRAKPLTRDDAYTHIKWIETANADVTDPDTLVDFQKMLEITVLNERNKAKFAGVWIRPRSQMPVSFSDDARARFAQEANGGKAVTRKQIAADSALYERYLRWWETKRQAFFTAVRDYLRQGGINDAFVLYTGCPGEPGVGFAGWDFPLVTEKPDAWQAVLQREEHLGREGKLMQIITPQAVAQRDLYLQGLLSPGLDWGGWEVRHARPADDPQHYQ